MIVRTVPAYVTARLGEDPHLWSITLFDELHGLGSPPRIRP